MKSGILYGNAAAVDGIVDRIEEYLGQDVTVIATGGMSKKIIPHCKREMILDADLLLKGLLVIYEKKQIIKIPEPCPEGQALSGTSVCQLWDEKILSVQNEEAGG